MKELDQLKEASICFGKAYDGNIKECKLCFCISACKSLTLKEELKPESPLAGKISRELSNRTKSDKVSSSIQYPDFKNMDMKDLEELAIKRNAADSWKKFDNKGIRRMRLTMELKKTYVSKGE